MVKCGALTPEVSCTFVEELGKKGRLVLRGRGSRAGRNGVVSRLELELSMAWIEKDLLTEAHCLLEVNNHFNPTLFFQLNYELKKVCPCVKGTIHPFCDEVYIY